MTLSRAQTAPAAQPYPGGRPQQAGPWLSGAATLRAIDVRYGYGESPVLHGVSLTVDAGESVALMGPSGSGKTTLLHLLAGVDVPQEGTVTLDRPGRDSIVVSRARAEDRARFRRTRFGLVFQSGQLLGELTAIENVALPLLLSGRPLRAARPRAVSVLAEVGLAGLEHRRPGELSGGQQQRVAIARAVVTRPQVLFADEPTGAVDRRTGEGVMNTLLSAQREASAALVVVTHDTDIAARCSRIVHLRDGLVTSSSSS